MKSYLPLLSILVITSCSTAYKSGQTPDDVYFSPAREREEYVRNDEEKDDRRYHEEAEEREDRALRMRVRNRRWSTLEDVDYRYNYRPAYSVYYNLNSPWTSYLYWNYAYNPSCCCMPVVSNPKSTVYNRPRTFNLNTFIGNTQPSNPKGNSSSSSKGYSSGNTGDNNNYRGSGQDAGGFLRGLLGGNSNSNSGSSGSSKTSSPSSSSGSSSSGTNKASVRKF